MDFIVDDDNYTEEIAPTNNDFSALAVLSTPKSKSTGTLAATHVPTVPKVESGYDSDEEWNKVLNENVTPTMQRYLDQRDAKNNRVREEQLREQTNELVEQSSRQGTMLMNRIDRLERSNKSDSRGLNHQMEALVETLTDQKEGRMMKSLHDSKVKLKQQEDDLRVSRAELLQKDSYISNLQSRLDAAEGRNPVDGDDANGGANVFAGFDAVEVQDNTGVEHLNRLVVAEDGDFAISSPAVKSSTFANVGDESNYAYGADGVEGGGDNGAAVGEKIPFLNRQKEAEKEHVRRKNVASDHKEIVAWSADTLPGRQSSQYASVQPKIDTGRTIAKVSSTPVAVDSNLHSKVPYGRPPVAPQSTRKSSRRVPLATPKKVFGATTTPMRSTRSAIKRAAATIRESPSEGSQPKRARRSPRSASTK